MPRPFFCACDEGPPTSETQMKRIIKSSRENGFSAIELAVVVLIMGVILAVVVPLYAQNTRRVRTRACQTNLRSIDGAIQAYTADHQVPPSTIADLVPRYLSTVSGCPVNPLHNYSIVGDPQHLPVQARVICGDGNGRDGIEDSDHFN